MTPTWPIVCGTGHRRVTPTTEPWMRAEQRRVVLKLKREHGTRVIISGMAVGFDLGLAAAALDVGLDLWAYVPFPQQPDPWPEVLRQEWKMLLSRAAKVCYTADTYSARALHQRNHDMLRDATAVYTGWDRRREGGTAATLRKAITLARPIVWSDPTRRHTRQPRPETLRALLNATR